MKWIEIMIIAAIMAVLFGMAYGAIQQREAKDARAAKVEAENIELRARLNECRGIK